MTVRYDGNAVMGITMMVAFVALVAVTVPLFLWRRDRYPLQTRNVPLLIVFAVATVGMVVVIGVREVVRPPHFPCILYLYTIFTFPACYTLPHILRATRAYYRARIARALMEQGWVPPHYHSLTNIWLLMALFALVYLMHATTFLLEYLLQPELQGYTLDGCAITTEWPYFAAITCIYVALMGAATAALASVREQHGLKYEMSTILALSAALGGAFLALNINDRVFAAVDRRFRVSYLVSLMAIGAYCVCVVAPLAATYMKRARHRMQTVDFVEVSKVHSLDQVLNHTERLPYLRRFAEETDTYQYLECWLEISTKFRIIGDRRRRREVFWNIMQKYVAAKGAHTLDIQRTLPDVDVDALNIRSTIDPPLYILDDLREALHQYMEQDMFVAFIHSQHYRRLTSTMMNGPEREQRRREQAEIEQGIRAQHQGESSTGLVDLAEFPPLSPPLQRRRRRGHYQAASTDVDGVEEMQDMAVVEGGEEDK